MFTTSADEGHGELVVIVGAREEATKMVDPIYIIPCKRQKNGDIDDDSKDDDVDDDSEDDLDSQATIPCQDWEIKLHELVTKLSGGGQKIGDVDDDSEDDGDVDDDSEDDPDHQPNIACPHWDILADINLPCGCVLSRL